MPVTISEVAAAAGVSTATVSRAFTTPDLLNPATLERVREVAARLGYQPNRAARALTTGRTGNIGVVVPDIANPFFAAVLKGTNARARENDHVLFLADTDEDPGMEESLVRAMVKQVDGFILCSSRMDEEQLADVLGSTPVVLVNRTEGATPAVVMDSADGIRQAVEHLAALGHRKVAYLSGPTSSWSNGERLRGLREATASTGVEVLQLGPFAPVFASGVQAADLALASGATAVLAFNDLMAIGVLSRLSARGVVVPQEMSVIGCDDIAMAAMSTPPLTTIAMPTEASGRAAVDLLLRRLGRPGTRGAGPTPARDALRILPTHLLVRSSTLPPAEGTRATHRTPVRAARPEGD